MAAEPASEPQQRKSMLPFVVVGFVLLALGIGLALWQVTKVDGPDYEADCRLVEDKAPDLGPAQAQLLSGLRTGPGAGQGEASEGIEGAAEVFREMAAGLTDREFAGELNGAADAMDRVTKAYRERDLAAMMAEVQTLLHFPQVSVEWLDEHCPRWLGPGQWGEPGSTPTGDPARPTDLPSVPTEFPSLSTDVPSNPDLPSLPTPGEE